MNKKYLFMMLVFFTGFAMLLADVFMLVFFEHELAVIFSKFSIPSVIFMIIYCVILGSNALCFDKDYLKNIDFETYAKRIDKLGAVPIKLIGLNVVLHALFLALVFLLFNVMQIDSSIKNMLFLVAVSFGMLVGTFIYVISDGLVSIVLIDCDLSAYPRNLREGRQELKAMVIPVAVAVMSVPFASAVTMLSIHSAGISLEQLQGSAWFILLVPIIIFLICIAILATRLKKNSTRLYSSIVDQFENLSSEQKDLTKRIKICSVDELGTISGMVNEFCDHLSDGIRGIKDESHELSAAGVNLEKESAGIADSITSISQAAQQVVDKAHNQIESVNTATSAVKEMVELIGVMEKSIGSQTMSMAQGSSAVEQMVGNIASIGNVTDKMAEQFKTVGEASDEGSNIQSKSMERIRQIVEQSQALLEANKIIATIAAQTNLLSMNAAIEAAHAGEMGKGFSVVADEIRKLAENSSNESRKISSELKQIIGTIDNIVQASVESGKAFTEVSKRIRETEILVTEVNQAIHEQKTGADQVLDSLKAMNDINSKVNDCSVNMNKGTETMLLEIDSLHGNAAEISSSMEEVSGEIKKIDAGAHDVSRLAGVSRASITKISSIADEFNV